MKLPSYPRYKPSGIEWLGPVPEHWLPTTLRRISSRYSGGTPDRNNDSYWEDGRIPWINSGAVNQRLITNPSTFITEEALRNSSARWVAKGSLVMALAGQGKTKGMVAQTGIATTCNQSVAAICPTPSTDSRYLYWLLVSQYEQIRNMAGGEQRDGLNLEILGSIPCLVPPVLEQTAIAAFLDKQTERIDRLVAKKKEFNERLKEARTARISRSVTRGLPPAAARAAGLNENPPLRPSGVEWLGEIPRHWELKKFGYISIVVRGASPRPAGDSRYFDGDFISWITVGEVTKDEKAYLTATDTMLTEDGAANSRMIRSGTLIMTNSGATLGVPKILKISGCANDGIVAFESLSKDADKLFLYYYLRSLTENLRDRIKQGSGQPNLNTDIVKGLPVPFPPYPEQAAIAAYLNVETAKLDALAEKVEEAIERLQEYRSALITAAVTGKIDVRKATT